MKFWQSLLVAIGAVFGFLAMLNMYFWAGKNSWQSLVMAVVSCALAVGMMLLSERIKRSRSPAESTVEVEPMTLQAPSPYGGESEYDEWVADLARQGLAMQDRETVARQLERLPLARGPSERRKIVQKVLSNLTDPELRRQFAEGVARVEVDAARKKAGRLKNPEAKLRVYETALEELRADGIPDELQAQAIDELEAAIRALRG